MGFSLKEHNAITGMADVLYEFLPGSGSSQWRRHVTFGSIAAKVGVGDNWPGGSKKPAIVHLLSQTFERDRSLFRPLILEVVRAGIVYRQSKSNPISPCEIDILNGHILDLGFKFPELWDPDFRRSLGLNPERRAKERIEEVIQQERLKETARNEHQSTLEKLKLEFLSLHSQTDRAQAGFALERLLNQLFALFDLRPRQPFRVTGEQIDGSFELDHEVYLLEAKWEQSLLSEGPLLVFRGKIEGKSSITRGVFICLNGISVPAKTAITQGKQPTFFVVDGHDLMMILCGAADLVEFLRQRRRLLGEEGLVCVPFGQIWHGSRNTA